MTHVDLRTWAVPAQYPIYERIAAIARGVSPSAWCVIGGLMTELVLAEAHAESPRTTTDGDVLAHLAVDPAVIDKIETVLIDTLKMRPRPARADIVSRYCDRDDESLFIDVLVPSRTRSAAATPRRLAAPGTGDAQFLDTLSLRTVTFSDQHEPFVARYPSLAGAFYAKASAWREINPPPSAPPIEKEKHLIDAITIAASATVGQLTTDRSRGFKKRLALVRDAVSAPSPTLRTQFDNDTLARVHDVIGLALDPEIGTSHT